MPLTTYEQVRPWAKAIKQQVLARRMPPWGAVRGFGELLDERSLTQLEIARVAEWVEGGAPEGSASDLPQMKVANRHSLPVVGHRVHTKKLRGRSTLIGIHPLSSALDDQVTARLPDGANVPLLWLHNYQAQWDRTFLLQQPLTLPAGTVIESKTALELVLRARKPAR
jgi:hypothetical protein